MDVCKAFISSDEALLLISLEWPKLAGAMGISRGVVATLRTDLRYGVKAVHDVIYDLFVEWRRVQGRKATLGMFIEHLDNVQMQLISGGNIYFFYLKS